MTRESVLGSLTSLVEELEAARSIPSRRDVDKLACYATALGYSRDAEMIQLYYNEDNYSNTLATAKQVIKRYKESLEEDKKERKLFTD